ncbi:chemotaxis protein CheA [Coralloluteibacterium stylophorae]|uniref:Chemotaxis protein CheA n=1 Tax=Coralloluteibacterium stylophorae TaxID=1776034 RepID=A0A8J7VT86_9GAMM|nr:chemotaxis protein CheA [Coralloluteibacterium stylophorae]MBS7457252.1 chemotaxis protein CheA [Coralloluteibacterium stylophorae]
MNMDMQRFQAVFLEESREGLDIMEAGLLALESGQGQPDTIHAVFRAAHSIKGGAGTFGLQTLASLTHLLETLLDEIRDGRRALTAAASDAMLNSVDVLRGLLGAVESGGAEDAAAVGAISAQLRAVLDGSAAPVQAAAPAAAPAAQAEARPEGWRIGFKPQPGLFMGGNDPLRIFRELDGLGRFSATADLSALPEFDALDPLAAHIAWDLGLIGEIPRAAVDDAFAWVEDECELSVEPLLPAAPAAPVAEAQAEPAEQASATVVPIKPTADAAAAASPASGGDAQADTTIRVSVAKVDALINLVGELVITQAMLQQAGGEFEAGPAQKLLAGLAQLERNTRDLQEAVIGVRMLPVSSVFQRFPRLVRDLAGRLGKQVRLQTTGESTEIDKSMIEKIADPLVHLVRNAIDHGLETPEDRRAAGKSETGTLTLDASHQGGHILIEVGDDGRGLNRERIIAKATERGLALPENPTDAQVWDMIFQPGFSTAAAVTDLSGRGVGMDVVRRNIQSLGGEVAIESKTGGGTRILVKLPLTLAILDGMTVAVGGETFVLPLNHVIESLQPQAGDIRAVQGDGRLLRVRGDYIPMRDMRSLYRLPPAPGEGRPLVVVVESEGRRIALQVDALLGQQQIVVKNLESNYRKVQGVSGATILGDGRVALIVDVGDIARGMAHLQAA